MNLRQGRRPTLAGQGRIWRWALLLWISMVGPATALELRIAVVEAASQVTVGGSTETRVLDAAGRTLTTLAPMQGVPARSSWSGVAIAGRQASLVTVQPGAGGFVFIGDRWYRGKVRLVPTSQGLTAVNHVDMEDYLASVVGKEMYPTWPLEALKAQAVAARSFALYRRQKQARSFYDLGDTTTHQVYEGLSSETPNTQMAATSTAGQILTVQGQIIEAVFHSSSGGHTENSEHIWTKPVSYLRGVPDFDQQAPVYQWNVRFTAQQLRQRLPGVGNVLSLVPVSTTPQGRIITMKVVGDAGTRIIKGSQLRSALGLRSTLFSATPEIGLVASTQQPAATPGAFQFNGRGFGHGLGMSQWGAYFMALQGQSYDQILQHYYQGTTLTTVPPK